MKYLFILGLFFFIANSIYSQDLVVTSEGDSLNCKITKVKTDNIYFTFKHKDEIRSTLLPMSNVKYHQFDFFQTNEVPKEKVVGYENYPVKRDNEGDQLISTSHIDFSVGLRINL